MTVGQLNEAALRALLRNVGDGIRDTDRIKRDLIGLRLRVNSEIDHLVDVNGHVADRYYELREELYRLLGEPPPPAIDGGARAAPKKET